LNPDALVKLVEDAVRRALKEHVPQTTEDIYLSVARAADVAEVNPATVRKWVEEGRLGRYRAGRELRVKRSELDRLLATGWAEEETDTPKPSRVGPSVGSMSNIAVQRTPRAR
jgi:excisionase family DNA binding protein